MFAALFVEVLASSLSITIQCREFERNVRTSGDGDVEPLTTLAALSVRGKIIVS